jgi:hypothetical protein
MSNIEISKDGIKTSIISYLANNSISIIIYFLLFLSWYLPLFGTPLNYLFGDYSHIPKEILILLVVLAFLLIYPIGIIIDTLSFYLSNHFDENLVNWIFKKDFRYIVSSHRFFVMKKSSDIFQAKSKTKIIT